MIMNSLKIVMNLERGQRKTLLFWAYLCLFWGSEGGSHGHKLVNILHPDTDKVGWDGKNVSEDEKKYRDKMQKK